MKLSLRSKALVFAVVIVVATLPLVGFPDTQPPIFIARGLLNETVGIGSTCSVVSPDQKWMAIADFQNVVHIFALPRGPEVAAWKQEQAIRQMAITTDARFLLLAGNRVRLVEISTGKAADEIDGSAPISISHNGKLLATTKQGIDGYSVQLWSLPDSRLLTNIAPPLKYVARLFFNAKDDRLLIEGGTEYGKTDQILPLSVPGLIPLEPIPLPKDVEKIDMRGDALLVKTAEQLAVRRLSSGNPVFQIGNPKPSEFWPVTASLSPDGRSLFYTSMKEEGIHRISLDDHSDVQLRLPPKEVLQYRLVSAIEPLSGNFVIIGENSDYQVVDGNNGSVLAEMKTAGVFGQRVSIDQNGRYLVIAGDGFNGVCVWDMLRSAPVEMLSSSPFADGGAVSANGQVVAISGSSGIDVYNADSLLLLSHLDAHARYLSLSPDGSVLAASDEHSAMTLWNVRSRQAIQQFEPPEYFNAIPAFTGDGKWVADLGNAARGGLPGTKPFGTMAMSISRYELTIHEVSTGKVVKSFRLPAKSHRGLESEVLAFSKSDEYLIHASADEIHVWNTKDWSEVNTLHLPAAANALSPSPVDADVVAVALANNKLGLWNIKTGKEMAEFAGSAPDVHAIAFGPNAAWLATLPISGEIQFWDIPPAKLLSNLLFFRNSQDWLLSTSDGRVDGSAGGLARVYRRTGGTFAVEPLNASRRSPSLLSRLIGVGPVNSTKESSSENQRPPESQSNVLAASANQKTSKPQFPQLELQTGNSGNVTFVAWGPEKRWVVTISDSGSSAGLIQLWDPSTGHQLRSATVAGKDGIASKDGKWIAISATAGVEIWDVSQWEKAALLPPGSSYALAFNPDSSRLLTATQAGDLYLWETSTWRQMTKVSEPDHAIGTAAAGLRDGFAIALGKIDCKFESNRMSCSTSGVRIARLDNQGASSDWLKLDDNQIIRSLASVKDGATLLALSNTGKLFVVDGKQGTVSKTLNLTKPDDSLHMVTTAEGRYVLLLAPFQFSIWDLENPSSAMISRPTQDVCCALAAGDFAADGTLAAGLETDLAIVGIAPQLKLQRRFRGLTDSISSLAFSDNSQWLASALSDAAFRVGPDFDPDSVRNHAAVRLWSLQRSDANVYRIPTHSPSSHFVGFLPDSNTLMFNDGNSFMKSAADRELSTVHKPQDIGLWNGATSDLLGSVLGLQGFAGGATRIISVPGNSSCNIALDNALGLGDEGLAISARYVATTAPKSGAPDETLIGVFRPADCAKVGELTTPRAALGGNIVRLAFTPDGSWLIAGGSFGVFGWQEKQWSSPPRHVEGTLIGTTSDPEILDNTVFPSAIAINRKGTLLAYGEDFITIFDLKQKKVILRFSRRTDQIAALAFSPDDRWIASGGAAGSIRLWEVASGQLRATLVPIRESNDWLVVTPDGLFDGTPAAWKSILWRFSKDNFDVSPVEVFFKDFYRPGLLQQILAGQRPTAKIDLAKVDRRQPGVFFGSLSSSGPVETATVHLQLEVSQGAAQNGKPGTGVRDVRVFRNGSLAKVWRGEILLDGAGKAELTADLPITAGSNVFTAFAYTDANIRSSETAAARLEVVGSDKLKNPATAWIIAVGVNHYADAKLSVLRYAVDDADDFATNVASAQNALGAFQRVIAVKLTEQLASRENVLAVLRRLGGDANSNPQLSSGSPEIHAADLNDAVFLFLAGHGISDNDRFYFLPRDASLDLKADRIVHGISDLDLADALQNISARSMVLVVDACESGSVVDSASQQVGMTNSLGLAQLAFDKGLDVLTAGTAFDLAHEINSLHHGVLTYSLVDRGLGASAADDNPKDGIVDVGEWFTYASRQVPQLMIEERKKRGSSEAAARAVQTPRAYYRRDEEKLPAVSKVVSKPAAGTP